MDEYTAFCHACTEEEAIESHKAGIAAKYGIVDLDNEGFWAEDKTEYWIPSEVS